MRKQNVTLAPSILSADFAKLAEQIRAAERGGADWLHLDVMDGHFVPNITFGPVIVKSVRSLTRLPLDTHLMIRQPERYIEAFGEAGADRLTVHVETCPHLHRTVEQIRKAGMSPGVTLNPATPASSLKEIIPYVDLVLVMTVNPGFGGQKFIRSMLPKIREIRKMVEAVNPGAHVEADGGVDAANAAAIVAAGADVLVAGHAIFSHRNVASAVRNLRRAASR
jgi:ribulose-phosphate 3-epimerase